MMNTKSVLHSAGITGLVLCVPLLAMQFTSEVNWNLADFVVFGILVFCFSIAYKFLMGKFRSRTHRIIVGTVIIVIFLLVWAELGVGIFGTPWAGS